MSYFEKKIFFSVIMFGIILYVNLENPCQACMNTSYICCGFSMEDVSVPVPSEKQTQNNTNYPGNNTSINNDSRMNSSLLKKENSEEEEKEEEEENPRWGIKSNLLFDAILLPNLEGEFYFSNRWSVNLEYQCAWWTFKKSDRFYQIMSISPEVRFWFQTSDRWVSSEKKRKNFNGHYIGLYFGGGYYDLKYNTVGYQGEFYIAAGVSYGYYLPLTRNLGLEFSLGIGYLNTQYEKYERYAPMGAHYIYLGSDKTAYFGPTKAKVSLVWRIHQKERMPWIKW